VYAGFLTCTLECSPNVQFFRSSKFDSILIRVLECFYMCAGLFLAFVG